MKPRIYISRPLPPAVHERLQSADFTVEWYREDRIIPREVLLQAVAECEGLLCILTDPIDQEVMEHAPKVQIIANYAVGYNNIDVTEATRRGIAVTNTPGVLTDASADLAFALLISAARRIPESETYLRAGKFTGWGPQHFLGQDLVGRTLGIVGLGRIGKALAERVSGFKMKILYHSHRKDEAFEAAYPHGAQFIPLEELLRSSDFVSLHVPLTPETHHLIGEKELRLMQPHAILINTSRGPVVDEGALAVALKNRWIWAAGLDVYEKEPEIHPELLPLPNAVLCPHIGSATIQTRTRMGLIAAENLIAFFKGERPPNLVNPEVWKK